jgi:uncharacterized protein GlcG (DUF336 family)
VTDPFLTRPQVSLATALQLVSAALQESERVGVPVAVCVVDAAGTTVAAARADHAPLGAFRLACDKAYTSALWGMPSGDLRESSTPGGADWGITSTEGGRIVVYDGGLPLLADGQLAGAIGVSGGTGEQDLAIARTALTATLGDAAAP